MSAIIIGCVEFICKKNGGLRDYWFNGLKPSFNIDGNLIMCVFESVEQIEVLRSGIHYDLLIEIYDSYLINDKLTVNSLFHLNCGGEIIANGVIKEVL